MRLVCPMQHPLLAIILAVGPADTAAQARPLGAVAALVGQGTITHAADVERAPARVRDEIFVRDRIETAEQSVIRVLMGGRITVTIRERSIVTITDDPMCPLVEILTPNAVMGIRGSLVIAQVSGPDSDVTVLEAHTPVTIAPRAHPTQTTLLPIGHSVRVSGPRHAARIGQIRRATHEHLTCAADLAEVPGRPRDGGQQRAFGHEARTVQRALQARGQRRPHEGDEATAERAERAFAGRRFGAPR